MNDGLEESQRIAKHRSSDGKETLPRLRERLEHGFHLLVRENFRAAEELENLHPRLLQLDPRSGQRWLWNIAEFSNRSNESFVDGLKHGDCVVRRAGSNKCFGTTGGGYDFFDEIFDGAFNPERENAVVQRLLNEFAVNRSVELLCV